MNVLAKEMPKKTYGYDWIIGNERALLKKERFIDSDLNRSAPGNSKSSIYEERRAAEIIAIANRYNYIIDIHATVSKTGIFTIITKPSLENIIFSTLLPIKRNVFWYSKKGIKKGPISRFCEPPALEMECGPISDKKIILQTKKIIKDMIITLVLD